jgi:predicted ArsR family transcriptional regulator
MDNGITFLPNDRYLLAEKVEQILTGEAMNDTGSWLWWESHCPICSAARACRGFCRSELALFRRLLAPAEVEREQYLLEGDSRCLYRIRPPRP